MKPPLRSLAFVFTIAMLGLQGGAAMAHGNVSCPDVPKSEWRGQMELKSKLLADGWKKVRKVQTFKTCYEVYGTDASGADAEAFFNPKTFEPIAVEEEPRK